MIDNELEEIVLAMEQAGESPEAIGQVIEEYEAKEALHNLSPLKHTDTMSFPDGSSMDLSLIHI